MSPHTVCLVSRDEPGPTGTSRYTDRLAAGLIERGVRTVAVTTRPAGIMSRLLNTARLFGRNGNAFVASYPLRLRWPRADLYHLTVQTYATALVAGTPPGPTVVTVHDIIPHLLRTDLLSGFSHRADYWFNLLAMSGLRRADLLIAISSWTKQTVIDALGVPADRIFVVPCGIDHGRFRPMTVPAAFRDRYGLPEGPPYVLYVGSEDRRKNLETLWRAMARVVQSQPSATLLKVGPGYDPLLRDRLLDLSSELGLGRSIRFFGEVPDADLPLFYNVADLLVMPSLYEGFGFPVLEAMACGTPVVSLQRGSLAEIAGDEALTVVERNDPQAFAAGIMSVLGDRHSAINVATRARDRAAAFSWDRMVDATLEAYSRVLSGGS